MAARWRTRPETSFGQRLSREPTRKGSLAASIRARFAPLGGVELPVIAREPMRAPPSFDE